jgi:hypothetical protein
MIACSNCTLVKWWGNPTFWSPENLLLSEGIFDYVKRFLVMEKWDTGRRSGVTAPTCDVVLKYTRWAARSDAWAACQISTQVAGNNSIRTALQNISSLKHFFSVLLLSFFLYTFITLFFFLPFFLSTWPRVFLWIEVSRFGVSAHAIYITGFHAEFEKCLFWQVLVVLND